MGDWACMLAFLAERGTRKDQSASGERERKQSGTTHLVLIPTAPHDPHTTANFLLLTRAPETLSRSRNFLEMISSRDEVSEKDDKGFFSSRFLARAVRAWKRRRRWIEVSIKANEKKEEEVDRRTRAHGSEVLIRSLLLLRMAAIDVFADCWNDFPTSTLTNQSYHSGEKS